MELWRITKDGVLDECMIEWPQLILLRFRLCEDGGGLESYGGQAG